MAKKFGDDLFLSYQVYHRGMSEGDVYPTGRQAVPWDAPKWDPNDLLKTWQCKQFRMCPLEGLRRTRVKPLHYSKLSLIVQGVEEPHSAFLELLRETLVKHTCLSPDSVEGTLIPRDTFLIQSAPDIRRKLQKLAWRPDSTPRPPPKGGSSGLLQS